ncbi:MAG TPA: hypothetical protein VH092_38460, partial [Urbifossiella sp.]|nr:hypothetical protein [Urbifossiella sp.]
SCLKHPRYPRSSAANAGPRSRISCSVIGFPPDNLPIGFQETRAVVLDRRSPGVTAAMRTAGLTLQLFVDVRMDQDQMELEIPPEFVAACGRHGLGVYLISNDS